MKFWQLASVIRGEFDLGINIASGKDDWKQFANWFTNFDTIVKTQDRNILDFSVPNDFAVSILRRVKKNYFISDDGWLRSHRLNDSDQELSIVDVYLKFGGDIVEDVFEYGSVRISQ